MPTERKNQSIEELRARIAATPNVVLTDYRGLTVGELRTLRSALRKQSSTFAIIKNTLFGIALGDERRGQLAALLQGPTGVAFAGTTEPPVAAPTWAMRSISSIGVMPATGSFENCQE